MQRGRGGGEIENVKIIIFYILAEYTLRSIIFTATKIKKSSQVIVVHVIFRQRFWESMPVHIIYSMV